MSREAWTVKIKWQGGLNSRHDWIKIYQRVKESNRERQTDRETERDRETDRDAVQREKGTKLMIVVNFYLEGVLFLGTYVFIDVATSCCCVLQ